MGTVNEVLEPLFDEDGMLPPEKLREATELLTNRIRLSGKEATPNQVWQLEQNHLNYVIRNLYQTVILLKGEFLDLVDQMALLVGVGEDYEVNDYDPDADFDFMMQALAFDKVRRLYEVLLG